MRLAKIKFARTPVVFAAIFVVFSIVLSLAAPKLHISFLGGSGPYRWRNDDGGETSATFAAAEGTPVTVAKNSPMRLRLAAGNDGAQEELLRKGSGALASGAGTALDALSFGLLDTTNGYAYYASGDTPAKITKVALGNATTPPHVVGTMTLSGATNALNSAAIDIVHGYAYYGENDGLIFKVGLGAGNKLPYQAASTAAGTLLYSVVLDPGSGPNGYAYFATEENTSTIYKLDMGAGDAVPTLVGSVTLGSFEGNIMSGVIDPTNGYAYFGSYAFSGGGKIFKINLGAGAAAPTYVGKLTLLSTENQLMGVEIDSGRGYLYYGTDTAPAKIIKIALGGSGLPTRVGTLTLPAGEAYADSAVIDPASGSNGYAYFTLYTTNPKVVKIDLGSGAGLPTRVGTLVMSDSPNWSTFAIGSATSGYGYVANTYTSPGRLYKISLGSGASVPTVAQTVTTENGESNLNAAVIDATNGYAYFATQTSPAKIVKVTMGAGGVSPSELNAITLASGEDHIGAAVVDTANGYAYFATQTSPAKIVKVSLGSGSNPPTRTGTLTLQSGENNITSAAIDAANGYAYFGTATSPGKIIKVALGSGASLPTRTGTLTLQSGENFLTSAVVDTANRSAYFGTGTVPGTVVKIDLGIGSALPTRIGAVTLQSGENLLAAATIDTANGYAYFGTQTSPGRIVKILLGGVGVAPSETDSLTLAGSYNQIISAVADTVNGYAYFGTGDAPGAVVKVPIGGSGVALANVAAVALSSGEDSLTAAVIDQTAGYAYFGTFTDPGKIVKVSVTPKPSYRLEYGLKTSTCDAISSWTQVPAATGAEWQMASSSNVTDGQATTHLAGLTDPNTVFKAGQVKTSNSDAASVSLGKNEFTQMEYSIKATNSASVGNAYCFRLTDAGTVTPLTGTTYPEATIAVGAVPYRWRNDDGSEAAATFAAAEGTPLAIDKNTPKRLRLSVGNDGVTTDFARKSGAALSGSIGSDSNGVFGVDPVNKYGYFMRGGSPSKIIKVALNQGDAAPVAVSSLTLSGGDNGAAGALIDSAHGYGYFVTNNPPSIVKVSLNAGNTAPTRIGSMSLGFYPYASAIDAVNGYAYVVDQSSSPARIAKVSLGAGSALPSMIGGTTLASGDYYISSFILDTANGYGYLGSYNGAEQLIKIALGVGNALPTRVGALNFLAGDSSVGVGVLDTVNGYGYFSDYYLPGQGQIVKISLGAGNASPTRIGSVALDAGDTAAAQGAIDTKNGFVYWMTAANGSFVDHIVKMSLGVGNALPSKVASTNYDPSDGSPAGNSEAVADIPSGYLYLETYGANDTWHVVKVSIAPKVSYRLEYGLKTTAYCSDISSWTQVPATATSEAWQMAASTNVADGQATTHLTGISDPNSIFVPGQIKTTASQASAMGVGENEFTQMEYSVEATNNATGGANYCFRLTDAGTATTLAGAAYPEATIAVSAPPTPTLITPADNSYTSDSDVSFSWSSEAGATSYILSVPGLFTNTPGTNSWNQTLVPSGTYAWTVASHGAGGDSSPSAPFTFTVMSPPAPVSPADGSFSSDTAQTIAWSPVTGATSYHVFVTEQGGVFGGFLNTTTTDTHVDLTGLTPGRLYTWNITTVDALSVETNYSDDRTFNILGSPGISYPPDGTAMSNRSPSLTWIGETGATGYHIFVTSQGGSTGNILDETTATTTVDLTNLATGAYEWHVTEVDGLGHETAPSAATAFTVLAPPTLTSPNDGATLDNESPTLNWDAVTGAAGYHITVTTQGGTTGDTFDGSVVDDNFLALTGLVNGAYDWFVTTEDAGANQTAASATRSFTIDVPVGGTPPATPTQTAPTSGFVTASGDINFTWDPVSPVDHYNVYSPGVFGVGTTGTSWLQHDIPPGNYGWYVLGVNSLGTPGDPSPTWNYTVLGPPTLSAPADASFISSASPTLSWGPVTGATSYHVFATTHGGIPGAVHDAITTSTSVGLTGLAAGEYDWYVTSVDGASVETAPSSTFTFTVLAPPNLLTPIDAATVSTAPTLTWNTVSDVAGYHVYVTTHNGAPGAVHSETVSVTSLHLSGLASGTYDWYVTSVDGTNAETAPSSTFTFIVPAAPPPPSGGGSSVYSGPTATAPVITPSGNNNTNTYNTNNSNTNNTNNNTNTNNSSVSSVEVGTTDATFHFTNPGNANTFNLYDAPPNSSTHLVATNNDPNATSITETGLKPNATYGDRVITAVAYGTESGPSPAFPVFTTLLPTPDTITPVYDPNTQAVSFTVTGVFPNLTIGQSGIDFVIKNSDGKSLFDSGFVKTPATGSLAGVDFEPGESYTVAVTTRNSAGDLSEPKDYPIAIPASNFGAAKIVLTKTADKTDVTVTNPRTKVTTQVTKEVKYTVTAANTGAGIAKNFVLIDPLPAGIDFKVGSLALTSDLEDSGDVIDVKYDPATRTITAAITELEPHESFVISFVATPTSGTLGSIKNKASASWEE